LSGARRDRVRRLPSAQAYTKVVGGPCFVAPRPTSAHEQIGRKRSGPLWDAVSYFGMAGEELLIADASERDRDGLRQLFDEMGYVCTACSDPATAQDLVKRKFFPVAVVDLDFGSTNGGIDFMRFVQSKSKPTHVVMLAGRRSFEAAVEGLRLGVVDIVSKRPDQIQHLRAAVLRAGDLYRAGDKDGSLMVEVRDVLEDGLRIMFSMGRRLYGGESSGAGLPMKPAILIIDEDQRFLQEIAQRVADKPWEVSVELSGGSGLDKASTFNFQIVAVREQLMDLPGPMLIKSAQAQQGQTLGLLYSHARGVSERYEGGRSTRTWVFAGPDDLVVQLSELVSELSTLREERRYMQAFRTEHGNFLKRFAELKVRIDSLTNR
jgi:DNA-binding response OmpR family regulator